MIGPLGRQGPAATLRQHCPQMTQRRCNKWLRLILTLSEAARDIVPAMANIMANKKVGSKVISDLTDLWNSQTVLFE